MNDLLLIETIPLVGQIDEGSADRFLREFLPKSGLASVIWLCSYGGQTSSSEAIASAIQHAQGEVTIFNAGAAMSAAFHIYLAGDIRLCSPRSIFGIHQVRHSFHQEYTASEMMNQALSDARYQQSFDSYITERTKITREQLNRETDNMRDWNISPERAVELGIAHKIVSGPDKTAPQGNPEFYI